MFGFRINLFQALNRKKEGEKNLACKNESFQYLLISKTLMEKKMEKADWDWNLQTADIHLSSTLLFLPHPTIPIGLKDRLITDSHYEVLCVSPL